MPLETSPLAPEQFPSLPKIDGVQLATIACGLRYKGRTDLLLAEFAEGTTVAGVLTTSKTASAPVHGCRKNLKGGLAQGLIVNSGNSNAFTGIKGEKAVAAITGAVAQTLGCNVGHVFSASTGVIGQPLDDSKVTSALAELKSNLASGSDAWEGAARAIMTTDTFAKGATRNAKIGDKTVTINGIAKGSGMIAPDMATMLSFVVTDANIAPNVLQQMLGELNQKSFNSITVDSDTSTSDTLLMFATGTAGNDASAPLDDFRAALGDLLLDLAQQIVRDGEGATKFITINVSGAENDMAAKRIGLAIANSPLVKTAVAGEDANWGRIVMAVGKSGEAADRDKLSISIGGVEITAMGGVVEGYDETPVATHMKGKNIDIDVDVGVGNGTWTVWTCDLTHTYISINADYRS